MASIFTVSIVDHWNAGRSVLHRRRHQPLELELEEMIGIYRLCRLVAHPLQIILLAEEFATTKCSSYIINLVRQKMELFFLSRSKLITIIPPRSIDPIEILLLPHHHHHNSGSTSYHHELPIFPFIHWAIVPCLRQTCTGGISINKGRRRKKREKNIISKCDKQQ